MKNLIIIVYALMQMSCSIIANDTSLSQYKHDKSTPVPAPVVTQPTTPSATSMAVGLPPVTYTPLTK